MSPVEQQRGPRHYRVEIVAASIGALLQVGITAIVSWYSKEGGKISLQKVGTIALFVLPWAILAAFAATRLVRRWRDRGAAKPDVSVPTQRRQSEESGSLELSEEDFHHLARKIGITTASALRLRGSRIEPSQCISRTRSRLYFMGVLASKWVVDGATRAEFEKLLTRLDQTARGRVCFLIIDPECPAFNRLQVLRGGTVGTDSIAILQMLTAKHRSFEVRMYSALPMFRIIVMDEDLVTFSSYRIEESLYQQSKLGWESPHVVLDPKAPFPLAEAFELFFEETWELSRPLSDLHTMERP